jgi:hypothetical protein
MRLLLRLTVVYVFTLAPGTGAWAAEEWLHLASQEIDLAVRQTVIEVSKAALPVKVVRLAV